MECFYCKSGNTWRFGFYRGCQLYWCKSCKRRFSEWNSSPFYDMEYPETVVRFALKLYYKYKLTTIDASKLLKEFGIEVSDESIRRWVKSFTSLLGIKEKISYSRKWHIDESFVKVGSKQGYLFVVIDSNSNIIAILLSDRRDLKSAIAVLKLAYREAGFKPDVIVSDEYNAYPKAVKKVFGRGKVKHAQAHFKQKMFLIKGKLMLLSNNRIEGLFSHLKEHIHRFRGFKSFISGNIIAQGIKLFWNVRKFG